MVSASRDATVRIWDMDSGQNIFTVQGQRQEVSSVAFSPDGTRLASTDDDKTVKVWDASMGQDP